MPRKTAAWKWGHMPRCHLLHRAHKQAGRYSFREMISTGYLNSTGNPASGTISRFDDCSQTVSQRAFSHGVLPWFFVQPYLYNMTNQVEFSYDDQHSFNVKGKFILESSLLGYAISDPLHDYNDMLVDSIQCGAKQSCRFTPHSSSECCLWPPTTSQRPHALFPRHLVTRRKFHGVKSRVLGFTGVYEARHSWFPMSRYHKYYTHVPRSLFNDDVSFRIKHFTAKKNLWLRLFFAIFGTNCVCSTLCIFHVPPANKIERVENFWRSLGHRFETGGSLGSCRISTLIANAQIPYWVGSNSSTSNQNRVCQVASLYSS